MTPRDKIIHYADTNANVYQNIALEIHKNPEVSNYEFFACRTLSEQLKREGFDVKVDVAGHRTGFTASYKSAKPGPVIVFLAEYDALAGLGHGCGHNVFGAISSLAGASLKQVVDEVGGEVRVYGTPGEEGGENGSAKGSFVREGYLKDVDAALCAHPGSGAHYPSGKALGCAPVDIEFWGKASHASGAPEKGINALDGVLLTFNGINALRQHLPSTVRIHGIVVNGGDAPNTVPEYAKAKFYLRAPTAPMLDMVYKKVENIVAGAALMTGAKGRMQPYQNRVESMVLTPSLDKIYEKHLNEFGEKMSVRPDKGMGSSDVGNVSQVVPTIQPSIKIWDETVAGHSVEFKNAACSQKAMDAIPLGAKVLALTALDLICDNELLQKVKEEHAKAVKAQDEE